MPPSKPFKNNTAIYDHFFKKVNFKFAGFHCRFVFFFFFFTPILYLEHKHFGSQVLAI